MNIRAEKNKFSAIRVDGRGSIVRNNKVVDTGGSTVNAAALGMNIYGPGIRVLNNDIVGVNATGTTMAAGAQVSSANGAELSNNRIDSLSTGTGGITRGITISVSSNIVLVENHITNVPGAGIFFGGSSSGICRDNIILGASAPYMGGTDIGNNNYFGA